MYVLTKHFPHILNNLSDSYLTQLFEYALLSDIVKNI